MMKSQTKIPIWMNFGAMELQKKGTDANARSEFLDLIVTSMVGKQAFSFIAKGNKFKAVLPMLIRFENMQAKKLHVYVEDNPYFSSKEISVL